MITIRKYLEYIKVENNKGRRAIILFLFFWPVSRTVFLQIRMDDKNLGGGKLILEMLKKLKKFHHYNLAKGC